MVASQLMVANHFDGCQSIMVATYLMVATYWMVASQLMVANLLMVVNHLMVASHFDDGQPHLMVANHWMVVTSVCLEICSKTAHRQDSENQPG